MKTYRLYLQDLYQFAGGVHAQTFMKDAGFKVVKAQPETIGDCWFFQVEEPLPIVIPEFLDEAPGYVFPE